MLASKSNSRELARNGPSGTTTVLSLDGCQVVGQRTDALRSVTTKKGGEVTRTDGYNAVVMGAGEAKAKRTPKAQREQFAKAGVAPKRKVVEFRVKTAELPELGAVDIAGISLGKGFAGAMKRWNFGGLRATHGVSVSHRSHGSTGQCQDPGKVFKGKKMAGHYGTDRVTVQNLEIVRTDAERGIILVKGAVPGHEGGWVEVRDAVKKALPEAAPAAGSFRSKEAPAEAANAEGAE